MAQFIKTSRGFINLDRVDTVTISTSKVCIGIANSDVGFWFEGDEAERIIKSISLKCVFVASANFTPVGDDELIFNDTKG